MMSVWDKGEFPSGEVCYAFINQSPRGEPVGRSGCLDLSIEESFTPRETEDDDDSRHGKCHHKLMLALFPQDRRRRASASLKALPSEKSLGLGSRIH